MEKGQPDRILLVDDNATSLEILTETLEGLGHKLLTAKDWETALTLARETRPVMALLDIRMPGLDGFEVCRLLKEDPTTREVSVIFLSALEDVANKVRGLELGAVDFITKPFQAEEVAARVNVHLTIHRLKRDLEHELRVAQSFSPILPFGHGAFAMFSGG